MPLKRMFDQKMDSLKAFMLDPEQTVRCIRCDGDVKDIVLKILAGLERQPDNPHLMILCDVPFRNAAEFFSGLLDDIRQQYGRWETQLKSAGIRFDFAVEKWEKLPPDQRFVKSVSTFARGLPDHLGALVLILDPQEISDFGAFGKALAFLAEKTETPWLKYITFDQKTKPRLEKLEERAPKTTAQAFSLDPADIEKQIHAELAAGSRLSPAEQRQYTAMLAGFAFARKDYDTALKLQQGWVDALAKDKPSAEAANALYNLGNTHLAKKDYPAAEQTLGRALKIATDQQLKLMLPMILTNLGVALYRQKRPEEGAQSFRVAREICQAQSLRPAEAHVLDFWAQTYQADNKPDQAENCWLEALAVYDGITSDAFASLRSGGRADILDKLGQHYQATKQKDKLSKLKQQGGARA
jgi:tetratricopeptide (TPR) repeat protein